MKQIALIMSLIGLSVLAIIFVLSPPREISSQEDILKLENNQKVIISGKVIKENLYEEYSVITLNNSIRLKFSQKINFSLLNQTISAIGKISYYQNITQIKVIKIEIK